MSQQINLFNPVFLKKKKYFSTVTMLQSLGLILIGVGVLAMYINMRLGALTAEAASTSAALKAAQGRLDRINAGGAARQKSKALETDLQKAETDMQALQRVSDVLRRGDFGNTSGYAEYFRAFARQSIDGVWLTGIVLKGAGKEIGIKGKTLKPELVPAYINRLKREPVLHGKSFAGFDMRTPSADGAKAATAESAPSKVSMPVLEFELRSSERTLDEAENGGAK